MVQKRLTALLEELNGELERTDQLDPGTRKQIEAAAQELDALLSNEPSRAQDDHRSLQDRLLSFEVEHPRIAAIFGEAAELLARLGV